MFMQMDDASSNSTDENFYDVVDENYEDDGEHCVTPLVEDLGDDETQNLITTL